MTITVSIFDTCFCVNCRGMDLWQVYGLGLIIDVCVGCQFYILIGKAFECNDRFSGNAVRIKGEDYIYRSIRFSAVKVVNAVTGFPSIRTGSSL